MTIGLVRGGKIVEEMVNVFGKRIKMRLKQLKQTQRWLANLSNIPEQTISNIVNGRYDTTGSINQAVPIAKALQTSVDYLYGLTPYSEKPMYPSMKVRQLAELVERLPDTEIDRLIADVSIRLRDDESSQG